MKPLSMFSGLVVVLILGAFGCGGESAPPATKKTAASTNEGSVVTAPVDYIAATIRAGENAKGTVEIVTLQKAIETFQTAEGRFPESLDELKQKSYLSVLPKPPVGKKFQYDAASGKVELVPAN
jgi:hypothetical protein